MTIRCCNGCVAPKRTPTCHITCPEYIEQKAKHDAEREQINKAKMTQYNIRDQKSDGVYRANSRRKL